MDRDSPIASDMMLTNGVSTASISLSRDCYVGGQEACHAATNTVSLRRKILLISTAILVLFSIVAPSRLLSMLKITTLVVEKEPHVERHFSPLRSPLNDQTLDWDHSTHRIWLNNISSGTTKRAYMLVVPNLGWNQPDQEKGLMMYRSLRGRLLVQGWINHPWFHPTAFEDIVNGNMTINPNITYIVLPDVETCPEGNWPYYGGGWEQNQDSYHNRHPNRNDFLATDRSMIGYFNQNKIKKFFEIVGHNRSMLIKFDCRGWGPTRPARDSFRHLPVAVASYSARLSEIDPDVDQGLPPPGAKIANLTNSQVEDINTCQAEKRRRFFLAFVGNYRGNGSNARGGLARFHDNNRTIVVRHFAPEFNNSVIAKMEYTDVLTSSVFAAAPRGDNKFSYRFTEVLAAGAIPVVLSDDWVFPFRPEVVDWNECAVIIPENRVNETMVVLESISVDRRCRMRRTCWSIYERYMSSPVRIISGLLEGVERLSKGERARFAGVHCTDVASSNPLNHSYTQLQPHECFLQRR